MKSFMCIVSAMLAVSGIEGGIIGGPALWPAPAILPAPALLPSPSLLHAPALLPSSVLLPAPALLPAHGHAVLPVPVTKVGIAVPAPLGVKIGVPWGVGAPIGLGVPLGLGKIW